MISVRAESTTYLCLKGDSYTVFYTDLSPRRQSATPPTVLCSCLPLKPMIPHSSGVPLVFITICAASSATEWSFYVHTEYAVL